MPLKTKRLRRCIEITPTLVTKLRAHKLATARSGPHDFVFTSRAGTPHDHRNIGGRVLAGAVKTAGLEAIKRDGQVIEPAPTFHNLRHSHGSALIAAGWDLEEVSARLGHADVGTTQRAYIHAYDAARQATIGATGLRRSTPPRFRSSSPLCRSYRPGSYIHTRGRGIARSVRHAVVVALRCFGRGGCASVRACMAGLAATCGHAIQPGPLLRDWSS